MRLLAVPIFAAALVAADVAPPAVERPAERPVIILVHGRGQAGFDSSSLRREWKRDLDSALALGGLPRLRDEDVRLAWYADVLDPSAPAAACPVAASPEDGFGDFARDLLFSLASGLPDRDASGARALLGDVVYLLDPRARCAAEGRIGGVVMGAVAQRRPVVIVAYSLGSIVAHRYLSSLPADSVRGADIQVITLGSPLGVAELREILMPEDPVTRVPRSVRRWVNVYDPSDGFAAAITMAGDSARFENRATQDRATGDAHHVSRYLTDRATSAALASVLCANATDEMRRPCGAR
jgi:hypothetical protein